MDRDPLSADSGSQAPPLPQLRIPFFQVDAFTSQLFRGNAAAVCLFDATPPGRAHVHDSVLQSIALENQLSETAFVWPLDVGRYRLRWFTPAAEVDLCGHATLASAYVLFRQQPGLEVITFETASGELSVRREGETLAMLFPTKPAFPADLDRVVKALRIDREELLECHATHRDALLVLRSEEAVRSVRPDFAALRQCELPGNIVTAEGCEADFVSRFFAPKLDVPEDPVTGSAHCTLAPYWSERLGKVRLRARQLSARGGELEVELGEGVNLGKVTLRGDAVLYLEGHIALG